MLTSVNNNKESENFTDINNDNQKTNLSNILAQQSKECCLDLNHLKSKICSSIDKFHIQKSEFENFPRSSCEMNLPKPSTLSCDDQDKPKLRIIKIKKKRNVGDVELNEIKKKKVNNWKTKKDNLKRMVNLDLLKRDKNIKTTVYDETRMVPREIHELHDNTDDELFLKIENGSGSVSTINTEVSTKSKFEDKLKNTKDKYIKYQTKAINKLKSFIPKTRSNDNLKFMTASDISKSRTLVPENSNKINYIKTKPPRPPPPKKSLIQQNKKSSSNSNWVNIETLVPPIRPPIRPIRKKTKKSNCNSLENSQINLLPASAFYKELREKWLEKNGSKSNLDSICSTKSIPTYLDRKFSHQSANQSLMSDNFKYRLRADFHSNQQLSNLHLTDKQSVKSEPTTYAIVDLPPRPPIRKRLTVSSYLSGSSISLHRKLNTNYFSSRQGLDKSEQATDALFWKPYSWKSGRVRSLTELYIRKNQSPANSNTEIDNLQNKLNEIYCLPQRPPLPFRTKNRQFNSRNLSDKMKENAINYQQVKYQYHPQLQSQQLQHHRELLQQQYKQQFDHHHLKPNEYTNIHDVIVVRDQQVGPDTSSINLSEKEIQTSLEDFKDLDYNSELEYHNVYNEDNNSSPHFIDSSTNDEFESLAKTRNLSDYESEDRKIKKHLDKNLDQIKNVDLRNEELINMIEQYGSSSTIKHISNISNIKAEEKNEFEFEFEKEIKVNQIKIENAEPVEIDEQQPEEIDEQQLEEIEEIDKILELKEKLFKIENSIEDQINKIENPIENQLNKIDIKINEEKQENDDNTLNESYVTVNDNTQTATTSSKTIDSYHTLIEDKKQSSIDEQQSIYLTLNNYDPQLELDNNSKFDTDTLADLDSLADASLTEYLTPKQNNSFDSNKDIQNLYKPKRTKKRKNQIRNSGLDTDSNDDDLTDEIIGIAANLQKELKQLVNKQNQN